MKFHHNWIHNLNDDAMIVDSVVTTDLEVFQNVIMKSLEAIGFAGREAGGARKIYRNLIDLRSPTAGIRPRPAGHIVGKNDENNDGSVFRFGQLYKSNPPDGPLDLFQNTCLVANRSGLAGIQHYRLSEGGMRRSFNNIFVDVDPDPKAGGDYATALLPSPTFLGPTDGNCFFQLSGEPRPLLRYLGYDIATTPFKFGSFTNLDALRGPPPSTYFTHSMTLYGPGYEANSIEGDPGFRLIAPDGIPQFNDDLRLRSDGRARQKGVVLEDVGIDDPLAPQGSPDIGCYEFDQPGLQVGVDGRRQFPENSLGM
jgi:hypothetical protein